MAFHIIFPGGDRTKISVVEIPAALSYELSDYAVASRREFYDNDEAVQYAKELARDNCLIYAGDDDGFLD